LLGDTASRAAALRDLVTRSCYTFGRVRKLVVLFVLCAAAAAILPSLAAAADSCGRPDRATNWIDSAPPALAPVFAKTGTILAVSSGDFPAQVRQQGAVTIHFDQYLKSRVGLPTAPADPETIGERADRLFDYAAQQSSCSTPWIAENELSGAGLETPWSATNAQYRQNVLTYLRTLAAHGARPFLLVSSTPYTGGEAAAWWQQVAAVADIVRETYFSAKRVRALGPILGNRELREGMRTAIGRFLAIGIPASRLGVMLGFQSNDSNAGRAGLKPAQAWLDVVKWQALAARQVAQELNLSTIWSWGWTSYVGMDDPDFPKAACVWLWTRAASLCNGPGAAGAGWNSSTTEGQLTFPRGIQCTVGNDRISDSSISQVEALTGDREVAYSAVFARTIERRLASVDLPEVLMAERLLIAARFGGSRPAYQAALARAHVSRSLARGILADELRRAKVAQRMRVPRPGGAAVANFYESYPDLLVRQVKAKPAPLWLGGRAKGFVLEDVAPQAVFGLAAKASRTLQTIDGEYKVRAVGNAQPLGSMPLAVVAPAIRVALTSFAQGDAFEQHTTKIQTAALATTTCLGDDLPAPAPVELETFVPFLSVAG
jgi:hypothetical protein